MWHVFALTCIIGKYVILLWIEELGKKYHIYIKKIRLVKSRENRMVQANADKENLGIMFVITFLLFVFLLLLEIFFQPLNFVVVYFSGKGLGVTVILSVT